MTKPIFELGAESSNQLTLHAVLIAKQAVRFTPAGIAVLSLDFQHESEQVEAGVKRKAKAQIVVVAAGEIAKAIDTVALGQKVCLSGFLTERRKDSKSLAMHLNEFKVLGV